MELRALLHSYRYRIDCGDAPRNRGQTLVIRVRSARAKPDRLQLADAGSPRAGDLLWPIRSAASARLWRESVTDVADGTDQGLMFGAKFGPQPPDVDVHGAGAAVIVVAPHVGQ
jgi:hypothetical protein